MPASVPTRPTTIFCASCPLRTLPAFQPVTAEQLAFIQSLKVAEVTLPARATIVAQGASADRLFTLLSGWAFRFKTLPDGRRQILNFLLPGDLLGLQAKLFDQTDHGIESLSDVVLCAFSRENIWHIFRDQPALAFDVTWLGAREEALVDDGLLSAGRRTAVERLAALLLQLHGRAEAVGLRRAGGGVALPLSQAHLADALGLSAVHLNRTMQRLRRAGIVELGGGVLRLPDMKAIRALARAVAPSMEPRPLI